MSKIKPLNSTFYNSDTPFQSGHSSARASPSIQIQNLHASKIKNLRNSIENQDDIIQNKMQALFGKT